MPIIQPAIALSTRQEAFCRHYAASGNAADAARQAGYSERSARQTGCALLERPYVVERLRRIRLSWKRTERDETQIVLARLEQAWDAAVAAGSAYMMLRVLRFQAEIAGLVKPAGGTRARLWPVAHEDELGEIGAGEALEAGTEPGPLAEAVRRGRDRAERALARHRESREAMETQEGFDVAAHEEAARRLAAAVEERTRLPVCFDTPDRASLDGPQAEASLAAAWLATPQLRFDALAGWARERTRSERERNTKRRARLGVSAALPHGLTLGAGVEWRRTDYEGRWFLLTPGNVPRKDRTRVLSVSLLHRAFTLGGFSPGLTLARETRRSNAQLHDYRRTRIELRFVRQF